MFPKLNSSSEGFVLIEILPAVMIFALAAAVLSYSFANGLVCKKQITQSTNNFDSFITELINKSTSVSDIENIREITLPTNTTLDVSFNVEETDTDTLYRVTIRVGTNTYIIYAANNYWRDTN